MTNIEKAEEILECAKCAFRNKSECGECFDKKAVLKMAEWKDEQRISADTFRACIQMLNYTCYEEGTGVDEADIVFAIKQNKLL